MQSVYDSQMNVTHNILCGGRPYKTSVISNQSSVVSVCVFYFHLIFAWKTKKWREKKNWIETEIGNQNLMNDHLYNSFSYAAQQSAYWSVRDVRVKEMLTEKLFYSVIAQLCTIFIFFFLFCCFVFDMPIPKFVHVVVTLAHFVLMSYNYDDLLPLLHALCLVFLANWQANKPDRWIG